jgi:hypothetical protein
MTRRRVGQLAAAAVALAMFGLAVWGSKQSAIPALRIYDGYWMILGTAIGLVVVGPLVWRWPRERSLPAIVAAALLGSVAPLVISAVRHHIPITARLRGAWILGGADVVGPALIIGSLCLWFALREHGLERSTWRNR